jgi:hypothetical protein
MFVCDSLIRMLFNDLTGGDKGALHGILPAFVYTRARLSLFDDG